MMPSFTTRPKVMFRASLRTESAHRNPSGRDILRFAESSRVLSSHWDDAVITAFMLSAIR